MFSANTLQNSMRVTYARDVSAEIGGLRGMVTFVLSALHCPSALTRCQRHANAQCLNILLRTSGQNSFATLNKVSRAICCPHLFAVFPNDRFTDSTGWRRLRPLHSNQFASKIPRGF